VIALLLVLGILLLVVLWRNGQAGVEWLATLRLRGGYLPLLACLAQLDGVLTQQHRQALLIVSAGLLCGFCWLNRRRIGMLLIMIGIGLNMLVMVANGGAMPVSSTALAQVNNHYAISGALPRFSKARVLNDSDATFAWLGDRLLLPGLLAHLAAWSIGDLLLLAGVGRLLWPQ
jgi:hypothetical protein